ncbi:peroxiredoxin-like family protein [Spirosoma terrae]|uniref:thioredoxin-dependent peroxiredoxin n=1 Tax=Spirosoma terrae TaxID=1968276 RepID=A0A6L9LFW3_9BACT|nr:peroxiredoxin-like family protein [Spirosoma terrae]NDU97408.1 AhpC/TSA family protein [Spirosoma terrae]
MKYLTFICLLFVSMAFRASVEIPQKPEDISPLLVGETIPSSKVQTIDGQSVSLLDIVSKKPTVLIFYRGGWCPFCNRQLSELRTLEPDLSKLGYQILAVSTDSPENLKNTLDKSELTYTLLSDADVTAARAFGLAFKAPAAYSATLEKGSNGKNTDKLLPVPAVFLLNQQGVIKFEYINPNFKERMPAKLLKAAAESVL